jgi:hypothetical protein
LLSAPAPQAGLPAALWLLALAVLAGTLAACALRGRLQGEQALSFLRKVGAGIN